MPRTVLPFLDRSKDVEVAVAVVHVELCLGIVAVGTQALLVLCKEVEAEAVALAAYGAYAYYSGDGGVVEGSGIGDDLHTCHLVALQALQFVKVAHLAAVDEIDGRTAADDLQVVALTDDARHMAQHVMGGTHLFKGGTCDFRHDGIPLHTGMRQVSAHDGLAEVLLIDGIEREGICCNGIGGILCIGGKDSRAHCHDGYQAFHMRVFRLFSRYCCKFDAKLAMPAIVAFVKNGHPSPPMGAKDADLQKKYQ